MARSEAVFVPTGQGRQEISLDEIPDGIIKEIEEIYAELAKAGKGFIQITFDTPAEAKRYAELAKAYCEQRPGEPLRFRRSPVRGNPKNVLAFRVTDLER